MQIFQSKLLNQYPNLFYTFTTKEDGNLAFHVNDNPKNVEKNHENLAKKCEYKKETVVHMKQIHSNIVKIVDEKDNFKNPPTCDALITDKKNIPLMVMVADCSPLLFFDPITKTIAVAHAGRAGAFHNIVKNVLDAFRKNFHADTKDIVVCVGAAICQECYEVSYEIAKEAQSYNLEYALTQKKEKYFLNIRAILKQQLLTEGIQESHLEISPDCSFCHKDFFSYREDSSCGRFAGVIELR